MKKTLHNFTLADLQQANPMATATHARLAQCGLS